MIAIGSLGNRQSKIKGYAKRDGYETIPVISKGKAPFNQLSPFFLGPIRDKESGLKAKNLENFWQFLKVYPEVAAQKQKIGGKIVWEHPKETHMDGKKPNKKWEAWRDKGFATDFAIRHPNKAGKKPAFHYYHGKPLDIVEARKQIYIPYYQHAARKTEAYRIILDKLKAGEKVLLIDFDGPPIDRYPNGIVYTLSELEQLIKKTSENEKYFPFGHGYALAMALYKDLKHISPQQKRIEFYDEKKKYGYMSNYWGAHLDKKWSLRIDGLDWPSTEHYFQAQKFKDKDYREEIRLANTPNKSKALGNQRLLSGYLSKTTLNPNTTETVNEIIKKYKDQGVKMRKDWDEVSRDVMKKAVLAKFQQNPHLLKQLQETGNALLVEHSRDKIWGDGLDDSGKNRLGRILMRVRDELTHTKTMAPIAFIVHAPIDQTGSADPNIVDIDASIPPPIKYKRIITSPYLSCRQTAEIINRKYKKPVLVDARIANFQAERVKFKHSTKEVVDRVPNKETLQDFTERIAEFCEMLQQDDEPTLVITHPMVIKQIQETLGCPNDTIPRKANEILPLGGFVYIDK